MRVVPAIIVLLAISGALQPAFADDVQPRLFSNVPTGTKFLSVGLSSSSGEVTVDSNVPVADVDGSVDTLVVSYSRGLDLAGRSALATLTIPYADMHFDGLYLGQPASADRQGLADPRIRLAVNLSGAPAMRPEEFAGYRQRTIVGASVEVSIPAGRYEQDRVINIGSNRWGLFSQAGVSHRVRDWTVEAAVGLIGFSDNDKVLGSGTLEQDVIGTFRGTLRYHFGPALWVSAGLLYTYGGRTTLNGNERDDRQANWRAGVAVSMPLARRHQIQMMVSEGVTARIGSSFTTFQGSYTYTFPNRS